MTHILKLHKPQGTLICSLNHNCNWLQFCRTPARYYCTLVLNTLSKWMLQRLSVAFCCWLKSNKRKQTKKTKTTDTWHALHPILDNAFFSWVLRGSLFIGNFLVLNNCQHSTWIQKQGQDPTTNAKASGVPTSILLPLKVQAVAQNSRSLFTCTSFNTIYAIHCHLYPG